MSRLEQFAADRDDCVRYLDETHVSAANTNQPLLYCV